MHFTWHCSIFCLFFLSQFCSILPINTALVKDILSALLSAHPPSNCLFPSLAPLHPGKWFYPVEWLCKDAGTGFKLSPEKRKDAKRKIKKREAEKRFIRVQAPNVLALCKAMTHHPALYMNVWVAKAQTVGMSKMKVKIFVQETAHIRGLNHIQASELQAATF